MHESLHIGLCTCGCKCLRNLKKDIGPIELELEVTVRCLMLVLEIELSFSARAGCALYQGTISPGPPFCLQNNRLCC